MPVWRDERLGDFLNSSDFSTCGGTLKPAIDGCDASLPIAIRKADAWFSPMPMFLVWSTSIWTPSAT